MVRVPWLYAKKSMPEVFTEDMRMLGQVRRALELTTEEADALATISTSTLGRWREYESSQAEMQVGANGDQFIVIETNAETRDEILSITASDVESVIGEERGRLFMELLQEDRRFALFSGRREISITRVGDQQLLGIVEYAEGEGSDTVGQEHLHVVDKSIKGRYGHVIGWPEAPQP